jgi:hypothetical protein
VGRVTVLTNGAPVVTPRGSVLGAFLPKPRAAVGPVAAPVARVRKPRRSLRVRLQGRGRQVKDFIVATAAFACADTAAFQFHPWAGWLSVCVSLILIDHSVDRGAAPVERPE